MRLRLGIGSLFAVGVLTLSSFAEWADVPLEALVQDSDLIVLGTLRNVSEFSKDGQDYGRGIITVEEVIWGPDIEPGQSLILKWQNESNLICPRVEHKASENIQGIWLLTVSKGNEVRADYPRRFVAPADRLKVEKTLLKRRVSLRASSYVAYASEPIDLSIVFRNPTQEQVSFPGVQYRDHHLYLHPDVALIVRGDGGDARKRLRALANRIIVSNSIEPIVVPPGKENRQHIDLRELFDLEPDEYYKIQLTVRGQDPVNTLGVGRKRFPRPDNPATSHVPDATSQVADATSQVADRLVVARRYRTGKLMFASALAIGGFVFFSFVYQHRKRQRRKKER